MKHKPIKYFSFLAALAALATLVLSLLPFAAIAQRASADQKVSSELTVATVVKQANGSEQLAPAQAVKPGDMLQYTVNYKNLGNQAVRQLVATLPIPPETEYQSLTALPSGALASVDGKIFERVPLLRKVKQADGKLVDVPVPLVEYRFLRWPERDLAAGASYSVSARTRVISVGASVSAATPASTAR